MTVTISYQLVDTGECERDFDTMKEAYLWALNLSEDLIVYFSAEDDENGYWDNYIGFIYDVCYIV